MPAKMFMHISNGNYRPPINNAQFEAATLGANHSVASKKAPSALNASIIARIHNVRPGCGSCGRH